MKHHRGTARAEDWVLAGVERKTNRCFIVPCPGGKRTAAVLLPLIQRWVLPGTTIYTDGWRAYQQLLDLGYTHSWVNHTLYFKLKDPSPVRTLTIRRAFGSTFGLVFHFPEAELSRIPLWSS